MRYNTLLANTCDMSRDRKGTFRFILLTPLNINVRFGQHSDFFLWRAIGEGNVQQWADIG